MINKALIITFGLVGLFSYGCNSPLASKDYWSELFVPKISDEKFYNQPIKSNLGDAYYDARTILTQGASKSDVLTRTFSLEAIGDVFAPKDGAILLDALSDEKVRVRYAAAMGIGDMIYKPAKKKLIAMLNNPQTDQRVCCACIYALYRMGNTQFAAQLGPMLSSTFKYGRAAAALSMGKMGEKSAVAPLKEMLAEESDQAVQFTIREALARLGDKRAIAEMQSYALTNFYGNLDQPAIPVLPEVESPNVNALCKRLFSRLSNPPRIRVAAAGALGKIGVFKREYYEYCAKCITKPVSMLKRWKGSSYEPSYSELINLQKLAALAIGDMDKEFGINVLYPLLQSNSAEVRISAAWAILKVLENKKSNFLEYKPEKKDKKTRQNGKSMEISGGID